MTYLLIISNTYHYLIPLIDYFNSKKPRYYVITSGSKWGKNKQQFNLSVFEINDSGRLVLKYNRNLGKNITQIEDNGKYLIYVDIADNYSLTVYDIFNDKKRVIEKRFRVLDRSNKYNIPGLDVVVPGPLDIMDIIIYEKFGKSLLYSWSADRY